MTRIFTRILVVAACAGAGWLAGVVWRARTAVKELPMPRVEFGGFAEAGMAAGPEGAPEVRVFGDYECAACRQLERVLGDSLLSLARAGAIRFVYHHRPLRAHARGPLAAAVAYCAEKQDLGWEVHDALYASVAEWSDAPLTGAESAVKVMMAAAARAGASAGELGECLSSGAVRSALEGDRALADRLEIHAVPTVLLDGARLEFRSYEALRRHIRRRTS